MNIISFKEKQQERELQKRYEYIQSMIQINERELFDKLIAEQALTDERVFSCNDFINALKKHGHDPFHIFESATFMLENDFYEEYELNWYTAIEEALTYYAIIRKNDRALYEEALLLHPYISPFDESLY